jgi:murein DD-endopeptidase MepM/ murein hydrolase activator NlpD
MSTSIIGPVNEPGLESRIIEPGRPRPAVFFLGALLLLLSSSCSRKQEVVPQEFKPTNAREAYAYGLRRAGLAETALGRDWLAASDKALESAVEIRPPYEEEFYVDPAAAFAVAYRFETRKGQRIGVGVQGGGEGRLFMDLFRVDRPGFRNWTMVASAGENGKGLEFEARRNAVYVLRLQPELLRGGRFRVTIRNTASLGFPVAGRDVRAIGGGFGAPREGGRRTHHGVDIFAPRHTPVVAPMKGFVRFAGQTDVGGRNIWLRNSDRGLSLYFAHLETIEVEAGTYVEPGRVIGTVGNSGNARTTPPHLHFGVYAAGEGPVDPYDFVAETDGEPGTITAGLGALGSWVRVKDDGAPLRPAADQSATGAVSLARDCAIKVVAAAADMYRVLLPDGRSGYIAARRVEPAERRLSEKRVGSAGLIRAAPDALAAEIERIGPGQGIEVFGRFGGFELVRTRRGGWGWLGPEPAGSD